MPILEDKDGKRRLFTDTEAAALIPGGEWVPSEGERINVIDDNEEFGSIPAEDFKRLQEFQGLTPATQEFSENIRETARLERKHDTFGQELLTGAEGLARGATFGLSDAIAVGLGADEENMRNRRNVNSTIAFATELTGAAAPALLSGGTGGLAAASRLAPSAMLAGRASAIGKGLGGLRGAVVAGGLEGAVFGAGQGVSTLALQDEKLTAEAAFSQIGMGALYGGALGGAFGGAGVGLERAGAGVATLTNKVKSKLVSKASPFLSAATKEGKKLRSSLVSQADEIDDLITRVIAKADDRAQTGFKFAADDDLAKEAFNTLRKTKSDSLEYALAATGNKATPAIQKTAKKVSDIEQKIEKLLASKSGAIDFSRASSLGQKKLGQLSKHFDDYQTQVSKLAEVTGSPAASIPIKPVSASLLQKIDGAAELSLAAKSARTEFQELTGKKGIAGIFDQSPEDAMKSLAALNRSNTASIELAQKIGGKDATKLAESVIGYSSVVAGASKKAGGLPPVAEMAVAFGIEEALIPDLPGPLDDVLKLYLATKMVGKFGDAGGLAQKALGKLGDKLPGGRAVQVARGMASDTSGRLASATGESIQRIQKGLIKSLKAGNRALKRSAPLTTQVLNSVSFAENGDKKSTTPHAAFAARASELSQAVSNPAATAAKIDQRLGLIRATNPAVADSMLSQAQATLTFLHSKLPKDPGTLQNYGKSRWRPTERDVEKFARYVEASKGPAAIVERFGDGRMTREDAEVLRELHPGHFAKVQEHVMDNLEDFQKNNNYRQRIQTSVLLGIPADPIMQNVSKWQSTFQQGAAEAGPIRAKPSEPAPLTASQRIQER